MSSTGTTNTTRGVRAAGERWLAAVQARAEQERERHLVVALGFSLIDRGRQAAAAVLAGALAFRLFLTILPLVLVAVVGLGYAKSAGGTPSDALKQFGVKGVLASTINHSASFHDPGRTAVLALGLFGLFLGARASVRTLRAIHALAWGMPVTRARRTSLAALVFIGVVLVAFLCGGLATRARVAAGVALGFGSAALLAVVVGGMWLGVSRLLPHPDDVDWRDLIPGSLLIGLGFAVLQAVTANWIGPKLDHEQSLYGSLGVAFTILGWLYVVGRLMVGAPLLNASVLEYRRSGHLRRG